MTAEVAVMNRMGIALAADSVVSIYANGVQPKTHDSVAKLFMLSEWYPVGIMVYNRRVAPRSSMGNHNKTVS